MRGKKNPLAVMRRKESKEGKKHICKWTLDCQLFWVRKKIINGILAVRSRMK
jgi:hypothetical protein